ncbi:MAG: hypothetical protein HY331_07585 [Chloroflexi bacterium]|nr:hypothetical protein [Chloroflexota bacterium]
MQRALSLVGMLAIVALAVQLALPSLAFAHERRTIGGGKYEVVVGFDREPAFVNLQNAASIRISRAGTQDPVEGVEKTLKIRIAFGGGQPREFALRAVFGQKGYYVADFFPTRTGAYIFIFAGEIEGTAIDERFESGPGRFDDVKATQTIQFPQAVPDASALAEEVSAARAEAATARLLAIGGLVVGLAGLAVGALALVGGRSRALGTLR